ncbi:MAG: non-heme iron oxygenase ferredoxin subunit [Sedimenticola sp.]
MSDTWTAAADIDEIAPGQMKRVEISGTRILLANAEGEYYAVSDTCSHEDASLYLGCLEGDRIKCSLHGARFSLKTGEALDEPADEPIATYVVKIEDNRIWIKNP